MATFTLAVNCDNAAFVSDDYPTYDSAAPELARILREAADEIERRSFDYSFPCGLRDINGNGVGHYQLKD
jgi:hypothetical protein